MGKLSPMSSLERFEREYVKPKQGRTLIVGSAVYKEKEDRRKRYPDVVGVDMLEGEGVDLVLDLEEQLPEDLGKFSHVECMSVLEHSKRPWLLAENLERLMEPGATIFVSVPFIWRFHGYPSDYWRISPEALPLIFPNIEWQQRKLASHELLEKYKVSAVKVSDHPYLARTETVGFGVLR